MARVLTVWPLSFEKYSLLLIHVDLAEMHSVNISYPGILKTTKTETEAVMAFLH